MSDLDEAQRAYDEALATYNTALAALSAAKERLQAIKDQQRADAVAERQATVSDRDLDVWLRRHAGQTYAAIAADLGISVSRVAQIESRASRKLGREPGGGV